jgi:hypothetical protein
MVNALRAAKQVPLAGSPPCAKCPSWKRLVGASSPLLDAHAYPHIFDAIVENAPTASLVVLRQTCRHLRERIRPMLFRHIVFVPVVPVATSPEGEIHIRTGSAPHLYLGRFRIVDEMPVPCASLALSELRLTHTLDMYFPGDSVRTLSSLYSHMPHLRTVRRIFDLDQAMWSRRMVTNDWQGPRAHTYVDIVNLKSSFPPGFAQLCMIEVSANVSADTKHHVIHLACDQVVWHDDDFPPRPVSPGPPNAPTRTLVLQRYVERRPLRRLQRFACRLACPSSCWERVELAREPIRLIRKGWPHAIVGAERVFPAAQDKIDAWHSRHPTSCPHEIELQTYDEWAARFGSPADPAPETMAGYYRWPGRVRKPEA